MPEPEASLVIDPEDITDIPPCDAIQRIADQGVRRGTLLPEQARELVTLFGTPPGPEDSGLDAMSASQFVHSTLQLIQLCLLEPPQPRRPLINLALQGELERLRVERGGESWQLARQVCDEGRRGTDRRFTFGQVKEHPADPNSPSFFCGVWGVDCDGSPHRLAFTMTSDVVAGSVVWAEVADPEHRSRVERRLTARGSHPWALQVHPTSALGKWIAGLAGTTQIGQHEGQIPLGVLSEAVRRGLEPLGLTHLLLGPSRRDPPSRPWHAGAFLRRIDDSFDFLWTGYAVDSRDGAVVAADCTVRVEVHTQRLLQA